MIPIYQGSLTLDLLRGGSLTTISKRAINCSAIIVFRNLHCTQGRVSNAGILKDLDVIIPRGLN